MSNMEVEVGLLEDLDDPGCREFTLGGGDWPFKGFVVRQGECVYAYQNYCMHAGHPLNWKPDDFLTKDQSQIICVSHGAVYDIVSGECVGGLCPGKFLRRVDSEVRDGTVIVRGPDSA